MRAPQEKMANVPSVAVDAEGTLAALRHHRPDLVTPFLAALPAARAAVLARLWGALCREPILGAGPNANGGHHANGALLADRAFAEMFAEAPEGFTVTIATSPHATDTAAAFDDPATLITALAARGLPGATARLAAELANSVANLALARAPQPPPTSSPTAPRHANTDQNRVLHRLAAMPPADALATAEQLVIDGHPLHPGCRTRIGMSPLEVLAYAPEHRPVVDLELVEVPPDRWLTTGDGLPPLLPVHPWQRDHLLDAHPHLRPTGRRTACRPLMSLRTLIPRDDPRHHLKTAVDVQMTSAVRTVSPAAVHNGPVVTALLERLGRRVPGFAVLAEPAAGAVLVDGVACRSLAVVLRRAPVVAAGEVVLPLAALAPLVAEAVRDGYRGDPVAFFAALADVLVPPSVALLRAGVALEAHGQNTLVVLRDGRPVRMVYRYVGGVRVSPARLRALGVEAPPLHGDLASDDPDALRAKLVAALGVALAEQVAALARAFGVAPDELWRGAAGVVRRACATLTAGDRQAVLERPWPVKATTAMRLADDPLRDVWAWIPNPLEGA
jgi:staphyloferrin A synthase